MVTTHLIYRLPLTAFEIPKNKCAQVIQGGKKCLAVIRLCKFCDKTLQVWITGNHKSSNGDLQFLALSGQVEAPARNLAIQPEAVLVIPFTYFQAGRLPVRDHKYLLVGIPSPAEYIHGQFQAGHRIGMIWAYLQVGKIPDLY